MTHPAYPPIITLKGFHKCERPLDVVRFIDKSHRAAGMLAAICRRPNLRYDRSELMEIGGFVATRFQPLTPFTAFHFWILRINDTLPRTGWRIRDDYRIERISAEHENRLILRLGVAA